MSDNGELNFSESPFTQHKNKWTVFGPSTASTATIARNSNHSLGLALTRMTSVREPENFGLCESLFQTQECFYNNFFIPVLKVYASTISHAFEGFEGNLAAEAAGYADKHPKMKLYIQAYLEMVLNGKVGTQDRVQRGVVGKLKMEVAKENKYPRLVVSMGEEAALIGRFIAKRCKMAMTTPFITETLYAQFVPTSSYADLKKAFETLAYPHKKWVYIYSSDDSCMAHFDGGKVTWMDIDISSADKSHGWVVFEALRELVPEIHRSEIDVCISQLTAPLKIRNIDRPREVVKLKPKRPVLYSGSVLTTLTNNVASLSIAYAISLQNSSDKESIRKAAASAGYLITAKIHGCFQDIQFLKHSPVEDTCGIFQPVLNLGVFLRASGIIEGDLLGKKGESVVMRACAQQLALTRCMWPNTHFPLITAMRARFSAFLREFNPERVDQLVKQNVNRFKEANPYRVEGTWPEMYFRDSDICVRYRGAPELFTLEEFFTKSKFYEFWASPGIAHVLYTDYELGCEAVGHAQTSG